MTTTKKATRRVCSEGHIYYKSSDCPVCPQCRDKNNKTLEDGDLPTGMSSPARSALLHEGITDLKKLAQYSQKEILALHGIGKSSIPLLIQALKEKELTFKI